MTVSIGSGQAPYCCREGSAPKCAGYESLVVESELPRIILVHAVRSKMVLILAAAGILADPAFNNSEGLAGWATSVQDAQAGQASLKTGINAYKDGALEVSINALTDALDGSLNNQQRAEAFYFRGLGYRELGLPGQAILDLTSAVSLKNGLSRAQLKDATRNRIGALREAGITSGQSVIAEDASRTVVPIPPDRAPVPNEPPNSSALAPVTIGAISTGEPPPKPKGGFVWAVEKLLMPDWP